MKSRLERTTAILRQSNIPYWKVEYRNAFAGKTIDLFHIIDIVALDNGIVGLQVCGSDYQPHIRKITDEHKSYTRAWLENGGRLELHGWRKVKKKRGGKQMIWKPRIADILLVNNEIYVEERK